MKLASRIIRSPVLSARADSPIADCVRLMRNQRVGALLITSANDVGELVGIFTERDLLERIELIQGTDLPDAPLYYAVGQ